MKGFARRAYIGLRPVGQFVLLMTLAACGAVRAEPTPPEVQSNIAYGPLPAEQADLYLPAGPKTGRPAVVIIHGGGWVSGNRHENDGFATVLASMGIVVLNIDYRLADKAIPDTRWPAQLVDAQLAVRFLRAHAVEYGIDPRRLGAVGGSAGAQLAVFLGTLTRSVPGDESKLYANQQPNVKAVVDQFGPMDLPSMGNYGIGSIEAMFGTATPPPADLATASPLPSVSARNAPTYIIHGHADQVVPFDSSRQLVDALKSHNVPVELVPYDGDHGFGGLSNDEIGKLQYRSIEWLVTQLRQ